MKRLLLTFLLFTNFIFCSGQNIIDTLETKAINNQIPEKWNIDLFNEDKKWSKDKRAEPMNDLAFPVEKYDCNVFSKQINFQLGKSHFSGIAFGENKRQSDEKYVFKHELALIFYTLDKDYQIDGVVSSRNCPYLTMQGQIKLNYIYDFVGIKSPEGSGYLLVNLKSFDLRFGQTIIIFPNKDNSFFYLQSKEKPLADEDFDVFLEKLEEDKRIMEMIELVKE